MTSWKEVRNGYPRNAWYDGSERESSYAPNHRAANGSTSSMSRGYNNNIPNRRGNYRERGHFRGSNNRHFGGDDRRHYRDESRNYRDESRSYRDESRMRYYEPRVRYSQDVDRKTNNNNLVKRADWEAIMNRINEDGGVYTSDEDDVERSTNTVEKVDKDDTESISLSQSVEILEEKIEAVSITVVTTVTESLPSKTTSDESVVDSINDEVTRGLNEISVCSEEMSHIYFGIKEVSDLEFTCGSHIFHVHRQLVEHFMSNMDDLLSGKVVDWVAMNRILEILYNHRMSDEQFLVCTDNTDDGDVNQFWKDGNGIMHLARRLEIAAVKNYMDRAVAFYRCDCFEKCLFCSQQRRLFATVYNLEEAKARLQVLEPAHDLDESIFEEMLHV